LNIHADLIACHECDLLHQIVALDSGSQANCIRCGAKLYKEIRNSLDRTLSLTVTGLILFLLANFYPLLTFEMQGRSQQNNLISGVLEFFSSGFWGLGILVFLVSIIFPLIYLLGMAYVLVPLRMEHKPWKMISVFKVVDYLRPWAMIEVYMLGIIVAIVKLSDFATITPGIALFSFAGLFVVIAAANASLDPRIVWRSVDIDGEY
jgi:paraquat-inducible protein A